MEGRHPAPTMVELCSTLERALNFMHTGNVSVIATSAMNPLWIGLSLIHDGLPCINPTIVPTITSTVFVVPSQWPHNNKGQPTSASRGAQIRTYGEGHYNVCDLSSVVFSGQRIGNTDKVECIRLCLLFGKPKNIQSRTCSTLSPFWEAEMQTFKLVDLLDDKSHSFVSFSFSHFPFLSGFLCSPCYGHPVYPSIACLLS
jgi:hypothetical protein